MDQQILTMATALGTRLNNSDEALMIDLIEEAVALVLDYTGQKKLVGNLNNYLKRIAIVNNKNL